MNLSVLLEETIGERRLWAQFFYNNLREALGRSVLEVTRSRHLKQYHKDKLRKEAFGWFFSDEMYVGSFLYTCEILDKEPECIRRALESGKIKWADVRKFRLAMSKKVPTKEERSTNGSRSKKGSSGKSAGSS
jgi:hypothetical protein